VGLDLAFFEGQSQAGKEQRQGSGSDLENVDKVARLRCAGLCLITGWGFSA